MKLKQIIASTLIGAVMLSGCNQRSETNKPSEPIVIEDNSRTAEEYIQNHHLWNYSLDEFENTKTKEKLYRVGYGDAAFGGYAEKYFNRMK